MNEYLFSVIIPIKHSVKFLNSAINSVINQTVGFEDNIQLIILDGILSDESKKICNEYLQNYPNNVVYYSIKEKQWIDGYHLALNKVLGKYVCFLYETDRWSNNSYERINDLFEHYPNLNIVYSREHIFGNSTRWSSSDFVFNKGREIVDVLIEPESICSGLRSVVIKNNTIYEYQLDDKVNDLFFESVNRIIVSEHNYGIVKDAVYEHRDIKTGIEKYNDYEDIDVLSISVQDLLDLSVTLYGSVVPYLSYLFLNMLRDKVTYDYPLNYSDKQKEKYKSTLHKMLVYVEDYMIFSDRVMSLGQKTEMIKFKYGESFLNHLSIWKKGFYFDSNIIFPFSNAECLTIERVEISNDHMILFVRSFFPEISEKFDFYICDQNDRVYYPIGIDNGNSYINHHVSQSISKQILYSFFIPLIDRANLSFYIEKDDRKFKVSFRYGKFCPLSRALQHSHFHRKGWHIHADTRVLYVLRSSLLLDLKKQLGLWVELFKKKKKIALLFHIIMYIDSFFLRKKQIWLFSDRTFYAGDNGEYLFRYVNRMKDRRIKTYFCISKNSPEYKRIKKYGRVVSNTGWYYRFLFLKASKVISSHLFGINADPFAENRDYIKDLIDHKLVYLQHGVIKDNHSEDNPKFRTGFDAFITSGMEEYKSLFTFPYGYSKNEVWLTGLARHDLIYDCDRKKASRLILIAPTWREYDENHHKWQKGKDDILKENSRFLKTSYYSFFSRLLEDERLINVMKQYDYKGVFQIHPMMLHFAKYFKESEWFIFRDKSIDYKDSIQETSLLVTDYSSIAFDYAYAYRPCIYTQFDKKDFYTSHTYKRGYFDFEKDGFGPVCYDYESTIQAIISSIENGCIMEKKYKDRAEVFFEYHDGKNCERIFQHIINMDNETDYQ